MQEITFHAMYIFSVSKLVYRLMTATSQSQRYWNNNSLITSEATARAEGGSYSRHFVRIVIVGQQGVSSDVLVVTICWLALLLTSDVLVVALSRTIRRDLPQRLEAKDIVPAAAIAPLQCHAIAPADRYVEQLRGGVIVGIWVI